MQGPALPGGNCLLMALCGVTMLCVSSAVDRASAAFCVAPLRSPSTSAAGAASLAKHLSCPPGRQGSPLRSAFRVGRVPAPGEWCGGLRTRERRALRSGSSDTMPNRPEPVSPLWGDWTDIEVKAATVIWVNRMVIGLDLCPFALGSMPGLRVIVSTAVDPEQALDCLAVEMGYLVQQPKNQPATTLVIFPLALFSGEALDGQVADAADDESVLNQQFLGEGAGGSEGAKSAKVQAATERYRSVVDKSTKVVRAKVGNRHVVTAPYIIAAQSPA